ncbi:hypothetical protein RJ641_019545 [Dillenia turbinata]|uniref:Uncharacterized protein n=1 Tax=Dillenia turbinata TaxID=194707 RepID=A0AAN8UPL6_9MAGN
MSTHTTASAATTTTTSSKSVEVEASLWWYSFSLLLTDLESVSLSSDLPPPLLPNQKSREALNSHQVVIGTHKLSIQPELKDAALQISSFLCLDEVQSYILLKRFVEQNDAAVDHGIRDFLHVVLLNYYIERQCLLKCTRQIYVHAVYVGTASKEDSAIREVAKKLISDGLESKLSSVLQDLLCLNHPDQMDVDLFTLWAEEALIEDNLVLDILFLTYYEPFCTCNGAQWKKLCITYKGIISGSYNLEKLAVSSGAVFSIKQAKVQLLLILIETLDLETLLQKIHDAKPFREDSAVFSEADIQQMDALISSFDVYDMKDAGPLILSWAVFLCLISSLPGKQENTVLKEIDHIGYVRQAFEAKSLGCILDILQTVVLKISDGPIAGYRSVLRTFISAFIASYEINIQLEDHTFRLILEILCKLYRGEDSLCIQFWDKDSFVDGPIRCLLCNLEGEFPVRTVELIRLLSALCEGTWPAECVYNFLDKSVGISSLFEIGSASLVDNMSQLVEARYPLQVPGIECLVIPSKTHGNILKMIDNSTALVRWEYVQSGVLVLLLRLSQKLYMDGDEEVLATLDLLCRLTSFNMAVCQALMGLHIQATQADGQMEKSFRIDVVEIICTLVKSLSRDGANGSVMSMGVSILAKISPSHVTAMALKKNILDVGLMVNSRDIDRLDSSRGSWLLSGRLAKVLLMDFEQNDTSCQLVLDFTEHLLVAGVENDTILALVVFCLQFVLVNHENWKYKERHVRWKVTLKVLEVMKTCIITIPYFQKLGEIIQDILLGDSSIHSTLFRIICITAQSLEKLYVSRLFDPRDIEGLELAICSDSLSNQPVFCQALLSTATKPVPVVSAVISLVSYFRNPAIQVGSARLLSRLFAIADFVDPSLIGQVCFGPDNRQITELRLSILSIMSEQSLWNEELFIDIVNLLNSAACFQPAFLVSLVDPEENSDRDRDSSGAMKPRTTEDSILSDRASVIDALMQYVQRCTDLIKSNPRILLSVFNFLKALWQGAAQYAKILDSLKSSHKFWEKLSTFISSVATWQAPLLENLTEREALSLVYRNQCESSVLEIMSYDMFLQKKLLHAELLVKQSTESLKEKTDAEKLRASSDCQLQEILSTWCKNSVMGKLIKSFVLCEYDTKTYLRAKIVSSLLLVHLMNKLKAGDTGSLCPSFIEKLHTISDKLRDLPSFAELMAKYCKHGYGEENDMSSLIMNDLYYHLQGELEGRTIDHGPFKDLAQYLLKLKFLQKYQHKDDHDLSVPANHIKLFDPQHLKVDLGLDFWEHLDWKTSKSIAEMVLLSMQELNSMRLLTQTKLSALNALTTIISIYEEHPSEKSSTGRRIPEELILSCIEHICKFFSDTVESLVPILHDSEDILEFVAAQVELLLQLIRSGSDRLSFPVCILVLKASGSGLKALSDFRRSVVGARIAKLLLLSLLLAIEFSCRMPDVDSATLRELSNVSLGILPILCDCAEFAEYCTLSLSTIDLMLKEILTPDTWFPIIRERLQLQYVVQKIQDKNSLESIPVILRFFLTLARNRGGAEMLLMAGFFSSLRVLFADQPDGQSVTVTQKDNGLSYLPEDYKKAQPIWGLGLAVITAVIYSLGDSPSCSEIVESMIAYFFSEKAYLVSYYLDAPEFPTGDHDKKRPRTQKTQTSLTALKETDHTLMLICVLAKHRRSWVRAMKELNSLDSELRERVIHLLAFISRASQRSGDSPLRMAPLLCAPVLKEEVDCLKKPSFINSRNGWFALATFVCSSKPKLAADSKSTALVVKSQVIEDSNAISPTNFSDATAIQIYRITFLLLKFLSIQAEDAARRAEEVGCVDLVHFPELPVPEILHGLQDQAVTIITELCEANESKEMPPEVQDVCLLLLQIMDQSLYLELCVSQICGLRPVLGRVEDFSKEAKLFFKATEGHSFLKSSLSSLKQIMSFVYPSLLQADGILFSFQQPLCCHQFLQLMLLCYLCSMPPYVRI